MKTRVGSTGIVVSGTIYVSCLLATFASAEDLLIVTLNCDSNGQGSVTITATEALAAITTSGSTQTGFYLADIYSDSGAFFDYSTTGDLTTANDPSNNNPWLFRLNSSRGLNVYNFSTNATSSFTEGEMAFTGSLTRQFGEVRFGDLIRGNRKGNIYFPADSDDDIANAQVVGTYVVETPFILGDVNLDQAVDLLDIAPWIGLFAGGGYRCEADINQNGEINFSDINPFVELLLGQQNTNSQVAPLGATGDFFWFTAGLNQGASNQPLELNVDVGEPTTLYLYFSTNGPSDSDLGVGAGINVAASEPGVIRFCGAETFDFPITIDGTVIGFRWLDPQNTEGFAGPAREITDDNVVGLTAFTITGGSGIEEFNTGNPFLDEGYDPSADAFLFATVDFVGQAPGTISLVPGFNDLGIVNTDQAIDAQFAAANITVESNALLGDMNCDGEVNLLDVNPFVLAISDPEAYEATYPDCDINLADCNQDGAINLVDVDFFINLLGA